MLTIERHGRPSTTVKFSDDVVAVLDFEVVQGTDADAKRLESGYGLKQFGGYFEALRIARVHVGEPRLVIRSYRCLKELLLRLVGGWISDTGNVARLGRAVVVGCLR